MKTFYDYGMYAAARDSGRISADTRVRLVGMDIAAWPIRYEGELIARQHAAVQAEGAWRFTCDACGQTFADRMDHIQICKGPFPADQWHESHGDVLWWCWRDGDWLAEAPYVGTPLDLGHTVECHTHAQKGDRPAARFMVGGWPGYHTHWTRIAQPGAPGGEG